MSAKAKAVERLVQRLEIDLAERAVVEHDVRLKERHSSRWRQVDVLVTFKDGYRNDRWAFEVKCHGRPVGPATVEQWNTLQKDLDLQRVVLVSTSGYTEGAIQKAKQHGILLHTLEEALHDKLALVAPYIQSFQRAIRHYNVTPTLYVPPGSNLHQVTIDKLRVSIDGGQPEPADRAFRRLLRDELHRRLVAGELDTGWDELPVEVEVEAPVENVRVLIEGTQDVVLAQLKGKITLQNKVTQVPVPMRRWKYRTQDGQAGRDVFLVDLDPLMPNHSMEISIETLPDGSWRVMRVGRADPDLLDRRGVP